MKQSETKMLLDMLLGWARLIGVRTHGWSKTTYPAAYLKLVYDLYQEANTSLEKGGDPTDFAREKLLPLFGLEGARTMYGWTEQDVLDRWEELRIADKVPDRDLSVDEAVEILRRALKHFPYDDGYVFINDAINEHVAKEET